MRRLSDYSVSGPGWGASLRALALATVVLASGCATAPPGANFEKSTSVALEHPEDTRFGTKFSALSRSHDGASGFHILNVGLDGLLARVQLIDAAEKTLDLQYFIFRGDTSGRLITDALLRAADRGVRIRVLVDDGDTVAGDEQILSLNAHRDVQIRVFNPFSYRGHSTLRRALEFSLHSARLNYRMHNKLMVVDNSVALIGGRNVGNQYFQVDPESQFADDDVFAVGPIAAQLSSKFDEYWNSRLAIPAEALATLRHPGSHLQEVRERAHAAPKQLSPSSKSDGIDYVAKIASGEPYQGLMSGALPLVWTAAQVVCDSPEKKRVEDGTAPGQLMADAFVDAARRTNSDFLMITPYFVPASDELDLLKDLRQRHVHVRVVTNSMNSTRDVLAFAGYTHYRKAIVEDGVDLYEVRAQLGNGRGSGQTGGISRYGNYGLHAKVFVFDSRRIFIGSMNFDERSRHLNTEIGLFIDSPELAAQETTRFEAMAQPENSYRVAVQPTVDDRVPHLLWRTKENGAEVEYRREPSPSLWRRLQVRFLARLPVRDQL